MKKLLLALVFGLVSSQLDAQVTLLGGAALPGTCIPGQLFVVTGTPVISVCTATNVWTTSLLASGDGSALTWGTNYHKTGTLATGTTSARFFAVTFLYDGTNWWEIARTAVQT